MNTKSITKVVIKRFKSFPSAVLALDNPMFIVGRNGSGKSNLADVFEFVAEAMISPLQAVFDRKGGIAAVRNKSAVRSAPPNMGLAFEFGAHDAIESGRYAFEIKALPNYGYRIVREQCLLRTSSGERWWFDRGDSLKTNAEGLNPAMEPTALALPLLGGDERFAPAFKLLSGMRVYSIEPAKLKEMQDPDSGLVLRADGSNAASVLQELTERLDESEQIKDEIYRFMRAIVPNSRSVRTKKHGNKVSMAFVQGWDDDKQLTFDAFSMSDGTLRSLGLILAVFQRPSPSVLVIEEPESTIHPGALDAVLDLIRLASKNVQVVVTTHSPDLLDADWISPDNIRIVSWEKGASHVLELAEETKTALHEHLMGAGEMLRSNALHAAEPLFADDATLQSGDLFEDVAK
jgi:predicted ATPase